MRWPRLALEELDGELFAAATSGPSPTLRRDTRSVGFIASDDQDAASGPFGNIT